MARLYLLVNSILGFHNLVNPYKKTYIFGDLNVFDLKD